MTSIKEHGINISFASVASMIPVFGLTWFLIKPAVVKAVGDELQDQVQQTVAKEVRPISRALSVILENNADNLVRLIASMEFRRDFPPNDDWSNKDAQELAQLKLDLASSKKASIELKGNDDDVG